MKIAHTSKIVKQILEQNPAARDDDYLLWLKVLERVAALKNIPNFSNTMNFCDFISAARLYDLPMYGTVSRARRKLQARCEDLRGSKKVMKARAKLEREYREFARK